MAISSYRRLQALTNIGGDGVLSPQEETFSMAKLAIGLGRRMKLLGFLGGDKDADIDL